MAKGETAEKKRFCPRCGGGSMNYTRAGPMIDAYQCPDCGYFGRVILEDGRMADELKKRFKEHPNTR